MHKNIYVGNNLDFLRTLEDNSIDSVVTDPPYGLGKEPDPLEVMKAWIAGEEYAAKGGGFMGHEWDSFVPSPEVWKECFRVLKPGGHLLAFGGTRTYDWIVLGVRIAGFEIREMLAWLHGQGMPHGLNIGKAIDQAGGASPEDQARILRSRREGSGPSRKEIAEQVGCTESSIRDWEEGRSRGKGKPVEFIIPSPEYRSTLCDVLGYSSDERRIVGVSTDRRGDGSIYGIGHSGILTDDESQTDLATQWEGWNTALKPAIEPIVMARKPLEGTVVNNTLRHGVGGININACRVPVGEKHDGSADGRYPSNVIHDGSECVVNSFPRTESGVMKAGTQRAPDDNRSALGSFSGNTVEKDTYGDNGSAARYFNSAPFDPEVDVPFHYCAKTSPKERHHGLKNPGKQFKHEGENKDQRKGNYHPTVKPLALMEWLIRLVTPEGGTVLEPYAGSGTTIVACVRNGYQWKACEINPDYAEIASKRVEAAEKDSYNPFGF